jgi:hypothetical protein
MYLLAPDILSDARELSPTLSGAGMLVGGILWLLGARSHRFWVALATTIGGGLHGLIHGASYGMNPLAAGLLMAVAAGALALSLVRVLVFAAAGIAAIAVGRLVAPAVDEPLLCLLLGGLAGIAFYRLWITALTSFAGTLLLGYSGLCLADRFLKVDSVAWTARHGALLNIGVAAFALLGVLVQYLLERRRARKNREAADRDEQARRAEEERLRRLPPKPSPWWSWGGGKKYRRAG